MLLLATGIALWSISSSSAVAAAAAPVRAHPRLATNDSDDGDVGTLVARLRAANQRAQLAPAGGAMVVK
jgi:hypothetical protein